MSLVFQHYVRAFSCYFTLLKSKVATKLLLVPVLTVYYDFSHQFSHYGTLHSILTNFMHLCNYFHFSISTWFGNYQLVIPQCRWNIYQHFPKTYSNSGLSTSLMGTSQSKMAAKTISGSSFDHKFWPIATGFLLESRILSIHLQASCCFSVE